MLSIVAHHVCVAGKVDTKRQRQDLGGICRSDGRKDSPRKTADELSDQENLDVGSKEDDEEHSGEEYESANDDTLDTELGDEQAVEESAEECTDT